MPIRSGRGDPWLELFTSAESARNDAGNEEGDMVPYWVYSPAELDDEAAAIERHLPIAAVHP